MRELLEAALLGVIQGLTEFIPVSSSGHLVIAHELLGFDGGGLSFDVALHVGTLLALIIYFRKDLVLIAEGLFRKTTYSRLAWMLLIATLPAVFAGLILGDLAENELRAPSIVAINLIIFGALMLVAERFAKRRKINNATHEVTKKQAILMGLAQAVAIIPGVSRSGSTITAGLFVGLDRVSASRFSFLLAIPITLGASIKVFTSSSTLFTGISLSPVIIGSLAACLSGIVAINFLLKFVSTKSLATFAYYRFVLGLIILVFLV
jgi:undecaprenyl-diphosphatase